MLPEAPLKILFWKSAAAFQEWTGKAHLKPRTASCSALSRQTWNAQGFWGYKCVPLCLWRWHLAAFLDICQPAWLRWRTLLVCRANTDLYFWAPGEQDLPVSCSPLFPRAVASHRITSSFLFHTLFSLCKSCEEIFPLQCFSRSSRLATWRKFRSGARIRCREEICLLFLMGYFSCLCLTKESLRLFINAD